MDLSSLESNEGIALRGRPSDLELAVLEEFFFAGQLKPYDQNPCRWRQGGYLRTGRFGGAPARLEGRIEVSQARSFSVSPSLAPVWDSTVAHSSSSVLLERHSPSR